MKKIFYISTFFILFLCAKTTAQQSSIDSTLISVQQLYDNGMYVQSELEARRLLETNSLSDSVKIIIEKHIAFSSVAQGKTQSAIEHFIIILNFDSTFELDPVFTSPKILSALNEAKRKFLQRKNSQQIKNEPLVLRTPSVTFRAIVFPGWEQLHQGRDIAGYSFLSAGIGALASVAYCDIQRRFAKDDYLSATTSADAAAKYSSYNKYYKAEIFGYCIWHNLFSF